MTRPASVAAALGLLLVAAGQGAPLKGSETGLPLDPDLVGAWWRVASPRRPAEAVTYDKAGRYLRVEQTGRVERGLWTAMLRGDLRWLRRCPARGAQVSPADCTYFGRYLMGEGVFLEEEACPKAWEGALLGRQDFAAVEAACVAPTRRFADAADQDALEAKVREAAAASPKPAAAAAPAAPAAPGATGGGDMAGVWVGHIGSGPDQVRLVFSAMADGSFFYSFEAGGQEESSSGRWEVDGDLLVLKDQNGDVEKVPYSLEGDVLRWKDEDIGPLVLNRQS